MTYLQRLRCRTVINFRDRCSIYRFWHSESDARAHASPFTFVQTKFREVSSLSHKVLWPTVWTHMWVKKTSVKAWWLCIKDMPLPDWTKDCPHYHDVPAGVVINDKAKLHANTMLDLRVVRCACHCNCGENALKWMRYCRNFIDR